MAQKEAEFQSPYPPPPLYYTLYTDDNLNSSGPFVSETIQLESLEPPPLPGDDEEVLTFGVKSTVNKTFFLFP